MKKIIYLFLLLPFILQCKAKNMEKTKNSDYKVIDMASFDYIDGNANKYSISTEEIIYDPITPAESSTGTYSGGEPYTVNISLTEFEVLQETAMNCINKKEGLIEDRKMGSGTLIVQPGSKTFIFDMNSTQKKEMEEAIKSVTKK